MIKTAFFITIILLFQKALTQSASAQVPASPVQTGSGFPKRSPSVFADSIYWIQFDTDSGVVHAAVAVPHGIGPFPAIIILHGTHGFAQEYVALARSFAKNRIIGIAACWFAGRRGAGERFITPIDFNDAPPLVDAAGTDRFRIARQTIDSLIRKVSTLPNVQEGSVALFGHSRGAGATLDYILTHPGKQLAIILNSCGYPDEVIERADQVNVPVLILHGGNDNLIEGGSVFTNITKARQFEAALRAAKKDVEVKYYEESGHNAIFNTPNQHDDTVQRVSDFLRRKFFK